MVVTSRAAMPGAVMQLAVLCCFATLTVALCPAGRYNNAGECLTCEPGAYCPGDDYLYPCRIGTYAPANAGITSDNCPPCPVDGWCPGDGNFAKCGPFKGTAGQTGQVDASQCQCKPGFYGPSSVAYGCKACDAGKYSDVGSTSASQCSTALCGANKYCSSGVRYSCPYGGVSAIGSSVVTSCSCGAGYYGPGAAANCTDCPINSYCTGGTSVTICGSTTNRPLGMVTAGKNAKSFLDCYCAAGYYGNRDIGCTQCPAGYRCPGDGEQYLCEDGLMSAAGSLTCSACLPGFYCVNGLVRACGTNSLQRSTPTSCECKPGYYGSQLDGSDCTACPIGSYCAGSTPSAAVACGEGAITLQVASVSVSSCLCAAGYRGNGTRCTLCLATTYSRAGSTSCTACAAGSFARSAGMSACVACTPGFYQATVDGYTACTACPVMTTSVASATSCSACGDNAFALTPGSPVCSTCPITGYYGTNCEMASPDALCPTGTNCLEGSSYTVGRGFNVLKSASERPANAEMLSRVLGVSKQLQSVIVEQLGTTSFSYSSSLEVTPKRLLQTDSTSSVFRSTEELRSSMAVSLGIPPIKGMFGASASYSQAKKSMSDENKATTYRKTQLQFLDLLLSTGSPIPEFIREVAKLPTPSSAYDATYDGKYSDFVEKYGTHYVKSVIMGGTAELTIEMKSCLNLRMSSTEIQADIQKSFAAATGQVKAGSSSSSVSSTFSQQSSLSLFVGGGAADGVTETTMVMADWQQTVAKKMVPVKFTLAALAPVVEGIDSLKGQRLAVYIEARYAAQYNSSGGDAVVRDLKATECGFFGAASPRTHGTALALVLTGLASMLLLQL